MMARTSVQVWADRIALLLVVALVVFGLSGCKRITEKDFVGKWQSSRAVTPIHMMANGEWEIRQNDGRVLQYGVWRYADKKLVWSFKQDDGRIIDDPNPVLAVKRDEFSIKELNGTTTVFRRLD